MEKGEGTKIKNPQRTTAKIWWIITGVSAALLLLSFTLHSLSTAASIVAIIISLVMFIVGIVAAVIYTIRASKLDKILQGKGLLAHWTYTRDEWRAYAEKEYQTEGSSKKTLFFIIAAFSIVIGIIFIVINPESGFWVFVSLLGLIAITGFTAWFTTWYNRRQNLKYQGEARITEEGLYLNRQFHSWTGLGAALESVSYIEESPPLLEFTYTMPTRQGRQDYSVRVPIPSGQEAKALEILAHFNPVSGKETDI